MLFLIYTPLCFVCANDTNKLKETLKKNWLKYLLLSLVDVEANYFVVKAYSMTLMTTIQVNL